MGEPNGSYVTQREFARLERKVDDVGTDVKLLLVAHYRDEGADQAETAQHDQRARRLGYAGLVAGVASAIWWVPDAIAKLTHH